MSRGSRRVPRGRLTPGAVLLVAAGLLVTACGAGGTAAARSGCTTIAAGAAPAGATASGSWPYSNADLANTRDATGSTLSSSNVARLAQAWTFKLTGRAATGVRPYGR